MSKRKKATNSRRPPSWARRRPARKETSYETVFAGIVGLLETARRTSARTVNAIMTATYWEIGRRIVEHEQQGAARAEYREGVIEQLAADLTKKFGRGFGYVNLTQMRRFYLTWSLPEILQTPSEESMHALPFHNLQTLSEESPALAIRQKASA